MAKSFLKCKIPNQQNQKFLKLSRVIDRFPNRLLKSGLLKSNLYFWKKLNFAKCKALNLCKRKSKVRQVGSIKTNAEYHLQLGLRILSNY